MRQAYFMERSTKYFVWFMNLAYLNLLWMVFSVVGLLLFGVAPATSALFATIRKLFNEEKSISIAKTYFSYYKRDFVKGNGLFYFMLAIAAILFFDIRYLMQTKAVLNTVILYILTIVSIVFIITFVFLIPIFVQFKLSFFGYIKQAFFIGILHPIYFIIMVLGVFISYSLMIHFPILILFFGISLNAFIIMGISQHVFKRLQLKSEAMKEQKHELEVR